jgi:hypothetical protein
MCNPCLQTILLPMSPAGQGNFGDLRPVPDSNDPNDFSLHPIKKMVGPNDDLSMRQLWKLRQMPSRIWKAFESLQDPCGPLTESLSGQRIFSSNVRQRSKKLRPPAWCKPYSHALERSASASANTSSRSYPLPTAISLSPRASSLRISRSCSLFW